eukprot:TRINITY_DN429_c0_g1_i1.p1 TRINITY_DN429_c0_g1~~TRINITY_DN429_c0_g1_i1.p1  ORF type:complete len:182 (+),score=47.93 TRINITY_DN429_c0_g1_i1:633-1178(+)
MLKLKRPYDVAMQSENSSPQLRESTQLCKRLRMTDDPPEPAPSTPHHPHTQYNRYLAAAASPSSHAPQHNSAFVAPPSDAAADPQRFLPKRKRVLQLLDEAVTGAELVDTPAKRQHGPRMYSEEEVKQILNAALEERETKLREVYDRILLEKMQEQFNCFSRFNEDFISRQLRSNECSYLS